MGGQGRYYLSLRFRNRRISGRTKIRFNTLSDMARFIIKDKTQSRVVFCHTCPMSRQEADILCKKLLAMCGNSNISLFQLAIKIRLKFDITKQ